MWLVWTNKTRVGIDAIPITKICPVFYRDAHRKCWVRTLKTDNMIDVIFETRRLAKLGRNVSLTKPGSGPSCVVDQAWGTSRVPARSSPDLGDKDAVTEKTFGLLPHWAWIWFDFPDFQHDCIKEVYQSDVCFASHGPRTSHFHGDWGWVSRVIPSN